MKVNTTSSMFDGGEPVEVDVQAKRVAALEAVMQSAVVLTGGYTTLGSDAIEVSAPAFYDLLKALHTLKGLS